MDGKMKESTDINKPTDRMGNKAVPHAAVRAGAREESRNAPRIQCVATTKQREQCKAMAVPGSTKCRMHGGLVTGAPEANQNARTHGIYGAYLTDDEKAMLPSIQERTGKLDGEIELVRIRIRRLLAAENAAAENDHEGLELQKFHDKAATEYAAGPERVYERVDYSTKLVQLTGRLESLEKSRALLIEQGLGDDEEDETHLAAPTHSAYEMDADGNLMLVKKEPK
jgi:hypothetical protein